MARKTNDQRLRALTRELTNGDPLVLVAFVERLTTISALTRKAIEKDPKSFDNPVFNHKYFLSACDKIDGHFKD